MLVLHDVCMNHQGMQDNINDKKKTLFDDQMFTLWAFCATTRAKLSVQFRHIINELPSFSSYLERTAKNHLAKI